MAKHNQSHLHDVFAAIENDRRKLADEIIDLAVTKNYSVVAVAAAAESVAAAIRATLPPTVNLLLDAQRDSVLDIMRLDMIDIKNVDRMSNMIQGILNGPSLLDDEER